MKAYLEIEMPTSCYYCPMTNDGFYLCKATSPFKELEDDCEERRPEWCPLVPVPEHGDLIDRDALTAKFKEMGLGEHSLIERLFADGVYVMIDYAPTVIPADGKGIKVPTREDGE